MKLPFIDRMRGMAILLVMMLHSGILVSRSFSDPAAPYSKFFNQLFSFGSFGVEVFFFISGFLISYLYDDRAREGFQKDYWKKRLGRIFPLWFVFATIGFLIFLCKIPVSITGFSAYDDLLESQEPWFSNPFIALILTYLFLGFLSPLIWNTTVYGGWSIQSEMAHYGVYALLRNLKLWVWLLLLIALGLFQNFYTHFEQAGFENLTGAFARLNLFATLSFFFIGLLAQRVWKAKSVAVLDLKIIALPLVVWFWLLMLVQVPFGNVRGFEPSSFWALATIAASAIFVIAIDRLKGASRFLEIVGKYSYFLYFAHFWILHLIKPVIAPATAVLRSYLYPPIYSLTLCTLLIAICLAIGLPLAKLSYRFVESPILKLAHRSKA